MPGEVGVRVDPGELEEFGRRVLAAVGLPEPHAGLASRAIVAADLRGVYSHGVSRLPAYVARIQRDLVSRRPSIRLVKKGGAVGLIDAGNALGHVAASLAMMIATGLAARHGAGVVGVRSSNHFGMAAYYAMMAAQRGFIGIALSNSAPAMAPLGGTVPMLGTNPMSVALPAGNHGMVVLDMSTSVVARGKVRVAALAGRRIPLGWGLDRQGQPTDDPTQVLLGSLLPAAGAKGYALAVVIDLLSGVLTGSSYGSEVRESTDLSGPAGVGHLCAALKVESFSRYDEFIERMEQYARSLKNCPRAPGIERIYLPGEIEAETAAAQLQGGILVGSEVWEQLGEIAAECRIPLPRCCVEKPA
ncbi:MAG: Ldh family oxidoreductase [Bacillota bacterium]|nr:Ldh family oxidoreductase [Bacillota bacterium]